MLKEMGSSVKYHAMTTGNIVLDLDGVLVWTGPSVDDHASFFEQKGALLTAVTVHAIFPGVIEFLTWLHRQENVRVFFFSAGEAVRNVPLVDQMLKLAEVASQARVFSRHHLTNADRGLVPDQLERYGFAAGWQVKNLLSVVEEGSLDHTILVDDNATNVDPKQVKNFLYVPTTDVLDFGDVHYKRFYYDQQGYRFLDVIVAEEMNEWAEQMVACAQGIILIKREGSFEVYYQDRATLSQKKLVVDPTTDIGKSCERYIAIVRTRHFVNVREEFIKGLCTLVESNGGRAKKICGSSNRIYYVAGLLSKAFERAADRKIPLAEALYSLQFSKCEGQERHTCHYQHLRRSNELYELGLSILRRYNPLLEFTTPHGYSDWLKSRRS